MSCWVKHYEIKPDAPRIISTQYLLTIISPTLPCVHFTCRTLHINILFLPLIAQPRRLKPTVHFRTEHTYILLGTQVLHSLLVTPAVVSGPLICRMLRLEGRASPSSTQLQSSLKACWTRSKKSYKTDEKCLSDDLCSFSLLTWTHRLDYYLDWFRWIHCVHSMNCEIFI